VLSSSHTFSAHLGWAGMATVLPIAERAALPAIGRMARTHARARLWAASIFRRRFDHPLAELELALRLNPNFSFALGYHGLVLTYCGRWQEGAEAAKRALRLSRSDPYSRVYYRAAERLGLIAADHTGRDAFAKVRRQHLRHGRSNSG
jgi:tetratricopeptide (TPR) repeat protein